MFQRLMRWNPLVILLGFAASMFVVLMGWSLFEPDIPTLPLPKPHYTVLSAVPEEIQRQLDTNRNERGSISGAGYGFYYASYYDKGRHTYYIQLTNFEKEPFWIRWEPVYRMTGRSWRLEAGQTLYVAIFSKAPPTVMRGGMWPMGEYRGPFNVRFRSRNLGSSGGAVVPKLPAINILRR